MSGEALARRFHEAYERLAPQYGYETRADTKAFNPESANGRLMIAVCAELTTQQDSVDVERVAQAMWESGEPLCSLDESGRRGTYERLAHAAMSALSLPITQRDEQGSGGTFACPICGDDKPHHHTPAVVDAYQNKRSRS